MAGELGLKLISISLPDTTGSSDDICFCGFPQSGLDKYVGRLIRQGKDIIICNQIKENGKIVEWEIKERIKLDGRLSE
jgi:DNA mismatch repair ATPase MutS